MIVPSWDRQVDAALELVYGDMEIMYSRADYTDTFRMFAASQLEPQHAAGFAAETSPGGVRWEPWQWRPIWAPNDHPTLDITGTLKNSLIASGPGHVEDFQRREFTWGTSVPYGPTHQFGAEVILGIPLVGRTGGYLPPGTKMEIPARPFVGMSDESLDVATVAVADQTVNELSAWWSLDLERQYATEKLIITSGPV